MTILGIVWNPNDTLLNIGPLQLKYYNTMWIAAFALGWYLMKRFFNNEEKPLDKLDSLFVYSVVSIILGARLGHVIFYDWAYYQNHLIEILLPIRENPRSSLFGLINGYQFTGFTGLASHGAATAAIIAFYLFSKKVQSLSFLWIVDRVAIVSAIGGAFVRIGNFFNSEINGKPTDEAFLFATKFIRDADDMPAYQAVSLTKESSADAAYKAIASDPAFSEILEAIPFRHPVQLYEAFAYIGIFILMYYIFYPNKQWREKPGFLFGFWLSSVFTARFVLEYFKKSQGGFEEALGLLSTGQWLSIPLVLAGLYLMFRSRPTQG
ncbi:MAG: prolipoprotein diacylglyceryl transferase [Flavobacteriaceae bacterium]